MYFQSFHSLPPLLDCPCPREEPVSPASLSQPLSTKHGVLCNEIIPQHTVGVLCAKHGPRHWTVCNEQGRQAF